ncbi:MAG: GNAT family N-acetyltransferase [Deltaproteobacteria bacterium]|nr:GNAT family N-acetyltransferase [Deltaproteobacteria bacterium]
MLAPTIETARLLLRHPAAEDLDAFVTFSADAEATRFLGGPLTPHAAWRAWAMLAGAWQLRGYSMFSVIEKESGRWVGRVGPWMPEGWPGAEVGWGIAPWAQRRGYAREAATAALDFAFARLGFETVIHCIDPANTPSLALAARLGSRLLRRDVAAPAPLVARWDLYGQSREEWEGRARNT